MTTDSKELILVCRKQSGFTLIELMITIGIIAILGGMAFVGLKVVGTHGRTSATRATLESLKSMLTEVEVAGALSQVQGTFVPTTGQAFPPLVSPNVPTPLPAAYDNSSPAQTLKTGNVTAEAYDAGVSTARYGVPNTGLTPYPASAVYYAQQVMRRIVSIPRNAAVISQIPSTNLLKRPGTMPVVNTGIIFDLNPPNPSGNNQPRYPIILDAWGNPIIYVPAAGLGNVTIAGVANRVITSARVRDTYSAGDTVPTSLTYGGFDAGATGFWASAGPDGNFATGDDNLYSFEQ